MEESLMLFERASACRPADYQAPSYIGTILEGLGRHQEAHAAHRRCLGVIKKHLRHDRTDARAIYLGALALAAIGDDAIALEWAGRALAINPDESNTLYNVACVYSILGMAEEAIAYLRKAVHGGFFHRDWIEHDPDLEAVRAHPDFKQLLAELS